MHKPQITPLQIPKLVRRVVEFQAAESFPLEVCGILVGDHTQVTAVAVITKYETRTQDGLSFETDPVISLVEEFFGDPLGTFHSHPGYSETLSRPGDFKNGEDADSDLDSMDEDDLEWIVSIWLGKRRFRFRHRVYMRVGNAPRIVPVIWS